MNKWLIIGISGVTCGGKTTIANQLNKIFPASKVITQDDYFLPVEDKRHVLIEHLNHINFDILSSLDMDEMLSTINKVIANPTNTITTKKDEWSITNHLSAPFDIQSAVVEVVKKLKVNILIVEGFCIFAYEPIEKLCNLKYFVTLNYDECYQRRIKRIYEPPDCPGYFEECAWPEYIKYQEYVKENVTQIQYFNEFTKEPIKEVLYDVWKILQSSS